MNIINRLIKLANKIDQKDPKLADKLEKTASNWSEDPRSQWLPEGVSWDMPYLDRYLYQPKYQTNNIPSELVQHFKGYQEPWGGGNQTAQTDLTHAQSDIAKIDEALKNPNLTVQQKQSLHAYKLMFMSQGQAARQTLGQYDPRNTANNISQFYSAYIRPSEAGYNNGTTPWDTSGQPPRPQGVDPQAKWNPQTRQWSSIGVMGPLSGAIYDQNGKLIAQSSLNSINMIKTANAIDKENPKLADKLTKAAANMLNMYVPQNVLEQGWGAAGGGSVGGSLGGFHAQLELNTMGLDPASKNVAISLMGELVNQLPPYKQWVAAHQNLGADPQAVYQALGVMQQLYQMGIQDPSNMGKAMVASGPLDLQFASKQPSANHRSWGISSSDIMNHEIAHAQGKTSTPEAYMQMAVPDNKGIGGNVNPVAGYYKTLMENFMADQGKQEYGPNLDVWSRVVKEKAPQF